MSTTSTAGAAPADRAPAPSPATPAPGPGSGGETRRRELAAFLRSRRERIAPEQVGLVRGARRRTPGLRREEVAHLAAVGVTWYTWLEQARDIQVSAQVLDAIARALQLDPNERAHLFVLGGTADPEPGKDCTGVTESVRAMLRKLEPFPASVQNARYDILAYNRTFGNLLCDLDALPYEERNCLWLAFNNAGWAAGLVDRDDVVRVMVAKFRAAMAEHIAEPAWKHLLGRLQQSAEFRGIWERHEVLQTGNRVKRFHTRVGLLRLEHTPLWAGPRAGTRLITYVPADPESSERLDRLQARPAGGSADRAVSGAAGTASGAAGTVSGAAGTASAGVAGGVRPAP